MIDWFWPAAPRPTQSDASDDLLRQGDKERDAGDLTAALHFYGKALAIAGSPEKRKAALLGAVTYPCIERRPRGGRRGGHESA